MKTVEILNTPVSCVTNTEALDILLRFLKEDRNHIVVTPNPEAVLQAQKDPELMKVIRAADLVIPDGIGIVLASRFKKDKLRERVTGCDLIPALFKEIKDEYTVYLLGAAAGVAETARRKLEKKYPGITIVGVHDGYFNTKEEKLIIKEIQAKKPDILLVGLGIPKQEKWIYKHKNRLPVKISVGVGGSIDIYAGTVKRAPVFMQMAGLEWLHRLVSEPKRIFRMKNLPVFAWKVLFEKKR